MKILIKQATIIDPGGPWHDQMVDVMVEHGVCTQLAPVLTDSTAQVITSAHLHLSPGWMDLMPWSGEPGYEHRESLQSLAEAAAYGGYTALAPAPNTSPAVDNKSILHFIRTQAKTLPVDIYPLAAMTNQCQGKEISEMIDLHHAGAKAFTDGLHSIQDSGLFLRALQYVRSFDGLIIHHPFDEPLAQKGQIHEGEVSVSLGLRGINHLSEEIALHRDLALLDYSGSRLHVLHLSTAGAVELIRRAKQKNQDLTSSAAVMNLVFDHLACQDFDVNYKVLPPLRETADRMALVRGLEDGTIDIITSHHVPHDDEAKILEFPYAEFGAGQLETAWSLFNTHYPHLLTKWVQAVAEQPRRLLKLEIPHIVPGQPANFTFFDPQQPWTVNGTDLRSKSKHNPCVGQNLKGKVIGTIVKGTLRLN